MSPEEKSEETTLPDDCISEQIEFELDLIVNSSGFSTSSQMQNFLSYIVHKALSGEASLLKQYTIAVEALGQSEDFDPESNPLVRIEAGRLRKKLDFYYKNEGSNDPCLISVPVGKYIPLFKKNDNVYSKSLDDVATDGWKQSCGPRLLISCFADRDTSKRSSKLLYYTADNLAKVMSQFLMFRLVSATPHADEKTSNEVVSSYRKGRSVDYFLTVNVHQLTSKNIIRGYQLICQLIEAETVEVIWSNGYAVDQDNLQSLLSNICYEISIATVDLMQGAMQLHWARKEYLRGEESIDARYKVLVGYRYHADHLNNESFEKGVQACLDAIKVNPNDMVAHVVYCEYCRQAYVYGFGMINSPLEKGLKSGQLAVRINPNSHEAHYVLGQIWFHLGNTELCMLSFEKSRKLSKYNPLITFGTGFHLFFMEKWDEAMALIDSVIESESTHPDWYHMLPFLNYYRLSEYDQALISAMQIVSPGIFWGPLARAVVYGQLGRVAEAGKELEELKIRYPDFMSTGKIMLERYLSSPELFNKICDGLKKAGLIFEEN